jgi:hypothetical protein
MHTRLQKSEIAQSFDIQYYFCTVYFMLPIGKLKIIKLLKNINKVSVMRIADASHFKTINAKRQ